MNDEILEIADTFGLLRPNPKEPNLNTLNRDREDFYEVAVWNVKAALEAAYVAGRLSSTGDHAVPQDKLKVLDATQYIDPDGRLVSSAQRLAFAVIDALTDGSDVTVSLVGMKRNLAVSTSYFNTVLCQIADRFGVASLQRVHWQFASPAQKAILDLSRDIIDATYANIAEAKG